MCLSIGNLKEGAEFNTGRTAVCALQYANRTGQTVPTVRQSYRTNCPLGTRKPYRTNCPLGTRQSYRTNCPPRYACAPQYANRTGRTVPTVRQSYRTNCPPGTAIVPDKLSPRYGQALILLANMRPQAAMKRIISSQTPGSTRFQTLKVSKDRVPV